MIKDRPKHLLDDPTYSVVTAPPYVIDWSSTPELVKLSLLTLGGIQPITVASAKAADGMLSDVPTQGEINYYRQQGTTFQLIFVVASTVLIGHDSDGNAVVKPFAVTLIPASKRGQAVSVSDIDQVCKIYIGNRLLDSQSVYVGYDPFVGDWGLWGEAGLVVGENATEGFMDELGLVVDHFMLATEYDPSDVCGVNFDMPSIAAFKKYLKHRTKLLFTPFAQLKARRVWGVESPIELFLLQALAKHGLFPQPQMIVLEDGSVYPSLYDLWNDMEFRHAKGLISEVDFYFPDQKIALFCDGSHHLRKKQREKDQMIDSRLAAHGIRAVRIQGREIVHDLGNAVRKVIETVSPRT